MLHPAQMHPANDVYRSDSDRRYWSYTDSDTVNRWNQDRLVDHPSPPQNCNSSFQPQVHVRNGLPHEVQEECEAALWHTHVRYTHHRAPRLRCPLSQVS